MLSDVCLSVAYIGHKSRTERPRKSKIATEVAESHVTRTPLSRSTGQRSRSPGRITHRGINVSGICSGSRGNVLTVGTYCYVAVCRRGRVCGARRFGTHRGRGILWRPPAYSFFSSYWTIRPINTNYTTVRALHNTPENYADILKYALASKKSSKT